MQIEVVYAPSPSRQILVEVELAPGATIADALRASGLRDELPALESIGSQVGVFGRRRTLDTVLADGDRVEVYRPLLIDPKDARRRRAGARHR